MKLGKVLIQRDTYTVNSTLGKLYINDQYFCYTLEDVSRGENVKIPKVTCIPTGKYKIILTYSLRFKRVMPAIITEPNGYEANMKGTSWKGLRLHGGNTHENSEGCPLVAFNRLSDDLIQGTAEKALTARLQELGLKRQSIPLSGDIDYVGLEVVNS